VVRADEGEISWESTRTAGGKEDKERRLKLKEARSRQD
jgi:hypothetical protein